MIGFKHTFFDALKSPQQPATVATPATKTAPWASVSQLSQVSRATDANFRSPSTPDWQVRTTELITAGLPRDWAEMSTQLLCGPPPGDFNSDVWPSYVMGANKFAQKWGARAYRCGWTATEVFGLDARAPCARVDQRGLAWLLPHGAEVVDLDGEAAAIQTQQGSYQRYYRRKRP